MNREIAGEAVAVSTMIVRTPLPVNAPRKFGPIKARVGSPLEGSDDEGEQVYEQINGMLREPEAGAKTAEVCREHGISGATFYKWKAKYGGMEVLDARGLKALECATGQAAAAIAKQDFTQPRTPASTR
jgi:putative transposase